MRWFLNNLLQTELRCDILNNIPFEIALVIFIPVF